MMSLRVLWLRFLDRVKPRPGLGGSSPRVATATPAEAKRIEEILRRHCNHEWLYHERQPGEIYTGYCWRCFCETCEHEWTIELREDEDPDSEGVQCPACDSDLISGGLLNV